MQANKFRGDPAPPAAAGRLHCCLAAARPLRDACLLRQLPALAPHRLACRAGRCCVGAWRGLCLVKQPLRCPSRRVPAPAPASPPWSVGLLSGLRCPVAAHPSRLPLVLRPPCCLLTFLSFMAFHLCPGPPPPGGPLQFTSPCCFCGGAPSAIPSALVRFHNPADASARLVRRPTALPRSLCLSAPTHASYPFGLLRMRAFPCQLSSATRHAPTAGGGGRTAAHAAGRGSAGGCGTPLGVLRSIPLQNTRVPLSPPAASPAAARCRRERGADVAGAAAGAAGTRPAQPHADSSPSPLASSAPACCISASAAAAALTSTPATAAPPGDEAVRGWMLEVLPAWPTLWWWWHVGAERGAGNLQHAASQNPGPKTGSRACRACICEQHHSKAFRHSIEHRRSHAVLSGDAADEQAAHGAAAQPPSQAWEGREAEAPLAG